MPVVRDVLITLGMEQVLRHQGVRNRLKLQPQIMVLLQELLTDINGLLGPAFVYELHLITRLRHDRLYLEDSTVLHSPLFPSVLSRASKLAAVVCTIGPRLEEKVADYFARDDPLRAVILDGIGSSAVDILAQEACQFVKREAASFGFKTSSPLSPGLEGWPLSEQRQLFQLVSAEQIGVRLTPLVAMVPRKSISMAIGIGSEMPTWTQAEVCGRCNLRETCAYKVDSGLGAR